ncbi:MAG: HPr family phosphocarrier protein [Lachnospiraceae bacterium]|jgi:catabolite repression HPr-like protein|nr:HPr family phosphocarrier protein [Lachnospiraceae bacterium]MBP5276460.1 HPr family phosphocarrier protein [Lachnospiraceae bacterium]MBP5564897.1 HPr family phosphocarrier protein [Lachnospiraceae bacterium]MBQ4275537.1 HPr family phosphocarrier protein [Lachnospiraceae bacterium]MCR4696630.1 HPr family phosphocarrier protein [Lachnospiraceae bacterium]
MVAKEIEIKLAGGLEARPVAMLVQVASQYESSVYIQTGENKRVNAKSIMGMMSLGLNAGEKVTVEADGADEESAINHIEKYLSGDK